jgi:hypothetical protein
MAKAHYCLDDSYPNGKIVCVCDIAEDHFEEDME